MNNTINNYCYIPQPSPLSLEKKDVICLKCALHLDVDWLSDLCQSSGRLLCLAMENYHFQYH